MPRFFVVTRVACNRCGCLGPGISGEYDAKSAAVQQALAKGWTMRRESTIYAYEFEFNGPLTGRSAHIVDLGPTTAYDLPGLPPGRMAGCGQLRDCDNCSLAQGLEDTEDLLSIAEGAEEPVVEYEPTLDTGCWPHGKCDAFQALVEHHDRHHVSG